MAIGHLAIRSHTRSAGHSVAAGLAYRFRTMLVDSRTGITHDYDRPHDQAAASGFAYGETQPSWDPEDPQAWADAIESGERRKNSIVARDIDIALPHELTDAQRTELARTWASHVAHVYDVPVAWAVHQPSAYSDDRNHHAHFYVGTRALDPGTGLPGKKLREFTLDGSWHTITKLRHEWQTVCNDALDAARAAAQPAPRHQDRAASALVTHQYGDVTIDLRPFAEALEADRAASARMTSQPDAAPINMGAFARHDGYQVIDRDHGEPVTSWRMRRVGDRLHFDRTTIRRKRVACVVENRIHGYDAPHLTPTAIALERHARDVRDGDATPGRAPGRSDRTPTRGRQSVAELLEDGEPVTDRGRRGRRSLEERRAARKRRRRRRATAQTLRETEPLSAADTIPAASARPEPTTAARIPAPLAAPEPLSTAVLEIHVQVPIPHPVAVPGFVGVQREGNRTVDYRRHDDPRGAVAFRDHGDRITVQARRDPAAILAALRVARARNSARPVRVRGSAAFRARVLRIAATHGIPAVEARRTPSLPRAPEPDTLTRATALPAIPVQAHTVDARRTPSLPRAPEPDAPTRAASLPAIPVQAHTIEARRTPSLPRAPEPDTLTRAASLPASPVQAHTIEARRTPSLPRAPEPDALTRAASLPAIPVQAHTIEARRTPSLPRAPEPDTLTRATALPAIDNESLLRRLRRILHDAAKNVKARAKNLIFEEIARWKCTASVAEQQPDQFIIRDTANPDDSYVTTDCREAATLMADLQAPQPLCPRPSDDDIDGIVQVLDKIAIEERALMHQRTYGD